MIMFIIFLIIIIWVIVVLIFKRKVKADTEIDSYSFKDYTLEYNTNNVQRKVVILFNSCNELKELYMQSKIKTLIKRIDDSFIFLNAVSRNKKFDIYFKYGFNSFVFRLKCRKEVLNLIENEINALKELNRSHLDKFINNCLLNQAKRIKNKNDELLKKYKRKDHIEGRYKVIYESMESILINIKKTNNSQIIINEITMIKEEALANLKAIQTNK